MVKETSSETTPSTVRTTNSFYWRIEMLDLLFIALVIVFFGVAFWYVRFCERV